MLKDIEIIGVGWRHRQSHKLVTLPLPASHKDVADALLRDRDLEGFYPVYITDAKSGYVPIRCSRATGYK